MANAYEQFSTSIEGITPEEAEWIETVLDEALEPDDFKAEQERVLQKDVLREGAEPADLLAEGNWPGFDWEIQTDLLWLHDYGEGFNEDNLAAFIVAFIQKFRPDMIFAMGWACTCSKPRMDEFGGGWMVVTKAGPKFGSTYDAIRQTAARLEREQEYKEPVCPSCGSNDIFLCSCQLSNANAPIKVLVRDGKVVDFCIDDIDRELSELDFECQGCSTPLSLGMMKYKE